LRTSTISRRQHIHSEIDAAFSQLERDNDFVRNNLEAQRRHAGLLPEIRIVALQDQLLVLDVSNEFKWA
jgi:hypothetical protein